MNSITKLLDLSQALKVREDDRRAGRTVVWTNGTFDLLHPGHVASLLAARSLGDRLYVGLNSDTSVRGYKGPTRPICNERERATMLCALEMVDVVIVFDEPTPVEILSVLQPDIHCKGAEYAPPHGRPVPEASIVESYGGRVEYLPLVAGLSTTELIRRIRRLSETGT